MSGGRHRRSESGGSGHNRLGGNNASSSAGHYRSRSGVHERERTESTSSQLSNRLDFRSSPGVNDSTANSTSYAVRPTSLYPLRPNDDGTTGTAGDSLQPERESLSFTVGLVEAPPEVEQLVDNIKNVAEQFLYRWKTFPIILPSSIARTDPFPTSNGSDGSLGRVKCKYHLRDLFVAPSFDELDAVAVDSKGETRKLTGKQLEYIRERGQFEVESLNFPGQQHRWKLSELLQKGTVRSKESLINDLALALRFLFVTARSRLVSHFFSISQAVKALLVGFLRILDLLVGIPSLQAHNLGRRK